MLLTSERERRPTESSFFSYGHKLIFLQGLMIRAFQRRLSAVHAVLYILSVKWWLILLTVPALAAYFDFFPPSFLLKSLLVAGSEIWHFGWPLGSKIRRIWQ